jgi:hypothetical protein
LIELVDWVESGIAQAILWIALVSPNQPLTRQRFHPLVCGLKTHFPERLNHPLTVLGGVHGQKTAG